ncbi:hypothetical protein [Halolamina rubra]|uniref:hypothetical protein n=1 Tax=Halolamina rubra TaxID=1380430 RepID=UPI001929B026|nr:hypothetical protein [Halolamina rubra]
MGTTRRFIRALQNPRLFFRGLNRTYHTRAGLRSENTDGLDIFDEDWDTLIVLDACRYDMFEKANQLEGALSSRISKGSATTEWLQANFDGQDLRDTVYVTANPQLERNRENWDITLHETINVWLEDGWDEETGTVRAETVSETALDTIKQFPHKRLVVHYMQPHYPFVPTDTQFDKEHLRQLDDGENSPAKENLWNQKFMGKLDISREQLWTMYVENLNYALECVEELLEKLSGKTVVTGDHGNYVGERASPIPIREFGHPRGLYDDPVVRIPWLEYESGPRREITAQSTDESQGSINSQLVDERLQNLGYK